MKIIIMGAQGSGKGTQGELLAKELRCDFVSLGDILRKDPVVRAKLADGELLSDAEVDDIAITTLKTSENIVFDGYPRRQSQAETLIKNHALPDLVLEIVVPEDELIQRMLLRGREDDTEQAIRRRLEQYHTERNAIVQTLTTAGLPPVQVDGLGTVEAVFARVLEVIHG